MAWLDKMPKWFKILFLIVSIITMVYWVGYALYKILEALRKVLHWASDKRNWWTFLTCILILGVGSLLIAQFVFKLDPIGNITQHIVNKWNALVDAIANKIRG